MTNWYFWLHPLRGIAAFGVILLHCYWTWTFYDNIVVRKLYLMVDLFFILSGFVISAGYGEKINSWSEGKIFVLRRLRRLYVQYASSGLVWLVAALLAGVVYLSMPTLFELVRFATFTSFLYHDEQNKINPVAWSVMAEFWIYFSFALIWLVVRSSIGRIIVCGLICLSCCWWLAICRADQNIVAGGIVLIRAATGFYFGVFCFLSISAVGRFVYLFCFFSFFSIIAVTGGNHDLTFLVLFAAAILVVVHLQPPRVIGVRKIFTWMGDISYPLYLWHFIVSVVMAKCLIALKSTSFVLFEGERFVTVGALAGDVAVFAVVAISGLLAQAAMHLERRYRALVEDR